MPADAQSLKAEVAAARWTTTSWSSDSTPSWARPRTTCAAPAPSLCSTVTYQARLYAEEAAQIGLVEESASIGAAKSTSTSASIRKVMAISARWTSTSKKLPPPKQVEPTQGASLADHVQMGVVVTTCTLEEPVAQGAAVACRARLFVFTHSPERHHAISMTARMLPLLRDRAPRRLENAYLIERATARARKQLAPCAATRPRACRCTRQ